MNKKGVIYYLGWMMFLNLIFINTAKIVFCVKLPVLIREKAKTIFGVFKNPRHALGFIPRVLDNSKMQI
ncbi:MAG: hypothetical protein WC584_00510 [Candidatus Pacearchaeota archaeon]